MANKIGMISDARIKNEREHNQAIEIVSSVKDLNTLKNRYGFTQSEINELRGMKEDGREEIKKIQNQLKEAVDDLESARLRDIDSSDSDEQQDDLEEETTSADGDKKKRKRRTTQKAKYCLRFKVCDRKVKIDHCLCARLIIAGFCLFMIIFTMIMIFTGTAEI